MLIATPTRQHLLSLNGFEINLLNSKKHEIWQLIYVQRQSEGDAYANLVSKEGSAWLGKQTFRDTVGKWQREEPDIWPARPGYWGTEGYVGNEVDCAYQSCEESIGLCDEDSRSIMKTLGWQQSYTDEKILYDPPAHQDSAPEQQTSPTDTPPILRDAIHNKLSAPRSNKEERPCLNPPLNTQSLSVPDSQEDRKPQRGQAGSWLVGLGLDPDAQPSNILSLLSQSIYCSAYTNSLAQDYHEEDDFSEPLFARYESSSCIGYKLSALRTRKPVTELFGLSFDVEEDEQSCGSDDDDDDDDDGDEYPAD